MAGEDPIGERAARLYRGMRPARDGMPMTGPTSRTSGARPNDDIVADARGMVRPGTGGVAVGPDNPLRLPPHRRPPEFGGGGRDPIWRIRATAVGRDLRYRPDPENPSSHGFIEPVRDMPLDAYQAALAVARERWRRVVPEDRARR